MVGLVEPQRRVRVLDRVVRLRLDVLAKDEPRQEPERETTVARTQKIQIDRVDHLVRWNEYVCHGRLNSKHWRSGARTDDAKVFRKPVADKDAPAVNKQAQLLVDELEWRQRVPRQVRVQVSDCARCQLL